MKKKIKTGNKTTDKLYEAVRDYVQERGGGVVVIGGVALVQEDEFENKYGVMVRVLGKKPVFETKDNLK